MATSRLQYLQIVCLQLLYLTKIQCLDREFTAIRDPQLEGLMPPVMPLLNINNEMACALLCVQDETCTSVSYSKLLSFCMLLQERVTDDDKSTFNQISHFYNFKINEVRKNSNEILRQGYRWHEAHQTALRFHYYRPKDNAESIQSCQGESAELVTLDADSKLNTVVSILNTNKKLARAGNIFYYKPTNVTGLPNPSMCSVLTKSGTFTEVTCNTKLPYICEK